MLPRARLIRSAIAIALLLAGAGIAIAATLVHATWWGLPLGLVATAATLLALPRGAWIRLPFAIGWAAPPLYFAQPRPEGDYLVAGDWSGYVLLAAALIWPCVAMATLDRTSPVREESDQGGLAS